MAEAAADSSLEDADSDLRIASHDFSKLEDKHIKVFATFIQCVAIIQASNYALAGWLSGRDGGWQGSNAPERVQ